MSFFKKVSTWIKSTFLTRNAKRCQDPNPKSISLKPHISVSWHPHRSGHQADLKLDGSSCNALSVRHCCILFDKVTGMHELLNYSEYGTLVNSLLYGCSSSPHSTTRCACSPSVPLNGWEGPCQLSEGAQVQVGCQSFTFRTNPDFLWTPELVIPSDKLYHSPDKLDFMSWSGLCVCRMCTRVYVAGLFYSPNTFSIQSLRIGCAPFCTRWFQLLKYNTSNLILRVYFNLFDYCSVIFGLSKVIQF